MNSNIDIDPALARGLRRDVVAEVIGQIKAANRAHRRAAKIQPSPAGIRRQRSRWAKRAAGGDGTILLMSTVSDRHGWQVVTVTWAIADGLHIWLVLGCDGWSKDENNPVTRSDPPIFRLTNHAIERVHERLQLWTPAEILDEVKPAGQLGPFVIATQLDKPAQDFLLPTKHGALLGRGEILAGGKCRFMATTFIHDAWLGPDQRALRAALLAANDSFLAAAPRVVGVPHFGNAEAWEAHYDVIAEILKSHSLETVE